MSIDEFEMKDPNITMGADVTANEPAMDKAGQRLLQLRSMEIERQRPVNVCVLEAVLTDL